ncbi:immunity 8 family protein [Roseateles amylovorans]|uniref:Immunity 8 family protein n=1 Tax=Roseateles amylovorans TaxID=2978473 RepID=A0ABY6AU81_9BURK|nr:immunity 8 family protein [Roseateles amylovorans]UXH76784.1 immunity 8 family protein [Roseateles amylovorans]
MTLKGDLKRLHSPDLPDLAHDHPQDPANFRILVQALVGVVGQEAADTFNFMVCTPAWLAAHVDDPLPARGYLIVPRYDYAPIHAAIARLCASTTGPDWQTIAARLNLEARWEYDQDQ